MCNLKQRTVGERDLTDWLGFAGGVFQNSEPLGLFLESPEHGWTCFHCGERFDVRTLEGYRRARDHFGFAPSDDPACRIKLGDERNLIMVLRQAEHQLARYRLEDSDKDRAMYAMQARHVQELRQAEERGFKRGFEAVRENQ